jgi:polysaccharide export outer membrane protein
MPAERLLQPYLQRPEDGRYVEIPLPLSDMQKGKRQDQLLQADDIIYLPFSYLRNMAVSVNSLVSAAASAAIYRF